MNSQNNKTAMNQRIFEAGLPVETVSLYLLCCSLTDSGTSISAKNLLNIWNSSEDALHESLRQLEQRRILIRIISEQEGDIYELGRIEGLKD